MRAADREVRDLWAHLRDVDSMDVVPRLVVYGDADIVGQWGLPMKHGKVLIAPEKAGWNEAHFEHVLSTFGENNYSGFSVVEGRGKRIDVALSFPGALTYGHWIVDILARIEVALTCFDLKDIGFIVPGPLPQWARPFLTAYGIEETSLIEVGEGQIYRSANFANPVTSRQSHYLSPFPHGVAMQRLAAFGARVAAKTSSEGPKLLVRHKPMTSIGRRATLSNFDALERRLAMRGFTTIFPAEMSTEAQITAFVNAKIIVGEDSSALHNIAYSRSAQLIVINSKARKNLLHLSICELLGHRCQYVFCEPDESNRFDCDVAEVCELAVAAGRGD